jgi:hypothetical protein
MTDQAASGPEGDADPGADSSSTPGGETVAPTGSILTDASEPLEPEVLHVLDAWWRAANYLSGGPIYLIDSRLAARAWTRQHGDNLPDITSLTWAAA